jgi:hypothetical protein
MVNGRPEEANIDLISGKGFKLINGDHLSQDEVHVR